MKHIILIIPFLVVACEPPKESKVKQDSKKNEKKVYKRVKNSHYDSCRYKDAISDVLLIKKQNVISERNMPESYYSQEFHDLYDIRFTKPCVTQYYEGRIMSSLDEIARDTFYINSLTQ